MNSREEFKKINFQ